MKSKTLLVYILGITASIAVLFLIGYGGVCDNPTLYTAGIGIINFAFGSIITYYFKNEENDENKKSLEEWRKWYENEIKERIDEH